MRVRTTACLGLAAAMLAVSPAAAQDTCALLRSELRASALPRAPVHLSAAVERHRREIMRIEVRLRHMGCATGSIVVIGDEEDSCTGLASRLPDLEAELRDLVAERDAAIRGDAFDNRQAIQTELAANGCLEPIHQPRRASYSQFRDPASPASVLQPGAGEAAAGSLFLSDEKAVIHFDERSEASVEAPEEAAGAEEPTELIPLEQRLENRNVRVVGPEFLPDRSEAIDLTAPAQTLYR